MSNSGLLSARVLGRISLLQSLVVQFPETTSMLAFACRGLEEVSGVENVRYRLYDQGWVPGSELSRNVARLFPVRLHGRLHADLHFAIIDDPAFTPYKPYIENFCVMLAAILDERLQRKVNRAIMFDLEQRVHERTQQLEQEVRERSRAEQSALEEKQRLAITLQSIGDGVIATDIRGRVVLMSRIAEVFTGWTLEQARDKQVREIYRAIDESSGRECVSLVDAVLAGGRGDLSRNPLLLSREGKKRPVSESVAPIIDSNNEIIGAVLVFHDMSRQQHIMELTRRNATLESLGALAAGIAHEFNNLPGGVFGNIDLALEKTRDEGIVANLSKAMTAIERARELTGKMLTFSKAGVPVKKAGALRPVLEESIRSLDPGHRVICTVTEEENLRACRFDPIQIRRVFDGIIDNAREAMPNGGVIRVTVSNSPIGDEGHPLLRPGDYVRVSIKDEGPGMPPEVLDHIFDPFFTTRSPAQGMGLTTSYSIIRRHGGCIDVESQPGQGSTFHIYLPV